MLDPGVINAAVEGGDGLNRIVNGMDGFLLF
jgi:hypothetical protein